MDSRVFVTTIEDAPVNIPEQTPLYSGAFASKKNRFPGSRIAG